MKKDYQQTFFLYLALTLFMLQALVLPLLPVLALALLLELILELILILALSKHQVLMVPVQALHLLPVVVQTLASTGASQTGSTTGTLVLSSTQKLLSRPTALMSASSKVTSKAGYFSLIPVPALAKKSAHSGASNVKSSESTLILGIGTINQGTVPSRQSTTTGTPSSRSYLNSLGGGGRSIANSVAFSSASDDCSASMILSSVTTTVKLIQITCN